MIATATRAVPVAWFSCLDPAVAVGVSIKVVIPKR